MDNDPHADMPQVGSIVTKYNDHMYTGIVLANFCAMYTPEKGEHHETKCTAVFWDRLSENTKRRFPNLAYGFYPSVTIEFAANLIPATVENEAPVLDKLKGWLFSK